MMLSGGGGQNNPAAASAASAAASAGLISPDTIHPIRLTTFLRELPLAEITAHRALASLRAEFDRAGWRKDTPIAVGVYRQMISGTDLFKAVYVTADGVSLWPCSVRLSAGVLPLLRVSGVNGRAAAELAGKTDVYAKLETLVPPEHGQCEVILTGSDQDAVQYHDIVRAGEAFPVSLARRQFARVSPEDAPRVIAETMLKFGFTDERVPLLPEARQKMVKVRWDVLKPRRYDTAVVGYLIAEARDCIARNRLADAGFSIGEVLDGELKDKKDAA
jgi:hypothetical protein